MVKNLLAGKMPVLFWKNNSSLKALLGRINFTSDDRAYIKEFNEAIAPEIYRQHLDENLICCIFCRHLSKASCHEYCYKCQKGIYGECSSLLPGTFSFVDSRFSNPENAFVPWLFTTPCTAFERLSERNYFKNFGSYRPSVTVEYYEALEGIFTGFSRGKCPCHICAAVNLEIYNRCREEEIDIENSYCSRIIRQIANRYKAISGMIKYVE